MGRARVLEEIRTMRFEELLERHARGALTQAEAGEMLGMSERTFRRQLQRPSVPSIDAPPPLGSQIPRENRIEGTFGTLRG